MEILITYIVFGIIAIFIDSQRSEVNKPLYIVSKEYRINGLVMFLVWPYFNFYLFISFVLIISFLFN